MRYLVDDTRMIAIADAIRNKLNIEDLMTIDQMPELIMQIETVARPMINFNIAYPDDSNLNLSVGENTTWENFINSSNTDLEIDNEGYVITNSSVSPISTYSLTRTINYYSYNLIDQNQNKVSKNDIISNQNYSFTYIERVIDITQDNYMDYFTTTNLSEYDLASDGQWYWNNNNINNQGSELGGLENLEFISKLKINKLQFNYINIHNYSQSDSGGFLDPRFSLGSLYINNELIEELPNNNERQYTLNNINLNDKISFEGITEIAFTPFPIGEVTISNIKIYI